MSEIMLLSRCSHNEDASYVACVKCSVVFPTSEINLHTSLCCYKNEGILTSILTAKKWSCNMHVKHAYNTVACICYEHNMRITHPVTCMLHVAMHVTKNYRVNYDN